MICHCLILGFAESASRGFCRFEPTLTQYGEIAQFVCDKAPRFLAPNSEHRLELLRVDRTVTGDGTASPGARRKHIVTHSYRAAIAAEHSGPND